MFDDPITEVDVFDKMIFYKYIGLIDVRYENDISFIINESYHVSSDLALISR